MTGIARALLGGLLLAAPSSSALAEPARVDLRVEGGSEYDSNVHRLEADGQNEVTGAPLLRLGARARVNWRRQRGERMRLVLEGQGKLFAVDEARGEDVGVVAAEAGYERALAGRSASLGVAGSYYDAIPLAGQGDDALTARTFRAAGGEAQLAVGDAAGQRVTAAAGLRAFQYKPEPLFDWSGPTFGLAYHTTVWRGDPDADDDAASLELAAAYRLERRDYATSALMPTCADGSRASADCTGNADLPRSDLHHGVALEGVWTGARVYTARYQLEVNDSNSYGESLVRQRLELGVTAELVPSLYLTCEAAVRYNVFLDSLLIARDVQNQTFVSIDEENRNSFTALLAWKLGKATSLEARYALYSNELSAQSLPFRRQTGYLGVVHQLE